jgi:hypothetical protein
VWAVIAAAVCGISPVSRAADGVDYVREIKPILTRRCTSCHGVLKQKNSLRLDTVAALRRGGSAGPVIEPGHAADSLLIEAITGADGVAKMPPEGDSLTAEQIELLRKWIDAGAVAPDELPPPDPATHWAFQLPTRPAVPAVTNLAWSRNPVDAFIAGEHAKRGLRSSPPVAKHLLLRRVSLDLIGLPPTRTELHDFLNDNSSDAYEKVVDRLLASPHYGERWGRHWMDVWRYSDWDGYGAEVRESQPHIWRWRDWIIESLNADKGYDQMVVEMLAGDEVAPDDPATLRATGYIVRNWFRYNRNVWLDNSVEHTSKAFLGITLNCARCHDHMYDPIVQQDYYRFRAFFEAHDVRTDRVPGQSDTTKDGVVRVYDAKADTPTFLFVRGNDKQPDKDHPLTAGLPDILRTGQPDVTVAPVSFSATAYYPGLQPFVQEETLTAANADVAKATTALTAAQNNLATAKQKLADVTAKKNADPKASASGEEAASTATPFVSDDFAIAKPDLWKVGPGQWEHKDGKLIQSQALDENCSLTTQKPHPRDFVARFRFRTTGGRQWKSVGISFDVLGEQQTDFANTVYLSAYGGGKAQVSSTRGGTHQYPADGAKPLPVELNREYELAVAVRDKLLNVAVDGKLLLAYRLPDRSATDGRLSLWAFDATAEFLRVRIEAIPPNVQLVEQVSGDSTPFLGQIPDAELAAHVQQAEAATALAEKVLASAKASQTAIQARIAADRATYATPPAADAKDLSLAAGKAERELALRQAEQNVLQSEQAVAKARLAVTPADEKSKKAVTDSDAKLAEAIKSRDAAQAALGQPNENYTRLGQVYPATSTGRRLALASWIASKQNPLTARVAINHLWLRHFSSPLVSSVFDFGLNGKPPSHPALLDWLAVELMDQNWKMKPIHRLIVTSQAYRMQSAVNAANESNRAIDQDNVALWRFNSRRMEAEAVRDATLAVAGQLDRKMGGVELDQNSGLTVPRRSVYFRSSKEKKMTYLSLFDNANVTECYQRSESIIPQQALAQANSPLSFAQARLLAKALTGEVGSEVNPESARRFITTAFEQVLNRSPTADELATCDQFVTEQAQHFATKQSLTAFNSGTANPVKPSDDPQQRARENLIHVLLNHNDFLTIR